MGGQPQNPPVRRAGRRGLACAIPARHPVPMKRLLLLLAAALGLLFPVRAEEPAPTPGLPDGVIARVGDLDIPYNWFLHEFRSSFFRHAQTGDVRRAVFEPFLERMSLYAVARDAGVDRDPDLQAAVRRRQDGMRAYLEYQLAMAEVGMVIEAYLNQQGLVPDAISVTDEDLAAFLKEEAERFPGAAPESLDDLPEGLRDMLTQRYRAMKQGERIRELLAEKTRDLAVEVRDDLVESVPMPEIKGTPPPGMAPRPLGAVFER